MLINTKIDHSAFMILFATSAAIANDLETSPAGTQSASKWSDYPDHKQTRGRLVASNSTCPWLEGYPDCHPDAAPQPDIERPASIPLLILRDANTRPNTGDKAQRRPAHLLDRPARERRIVLRRNGVAT